MTRDELEKRHAVLCDEARELMMRKNHDYASEEDIFSNFREDGRMGVLVRLSDKMARLRSFMKQGNFQVHDESLQDTVRDCLNYVVLFEAYEEPCASIAPRLTTYVNHEEL